MMASLRTAFLSLFFPRTCPMCGHYMEEHQFSDSIADGRLCEDCLRKLPRTEQAEIRNNITEMCLADDKLINRAGAFMFYEKDHPIKQVIHKMKYKEQPFIAYQLGRQAAMEWQYADFFDGIDIIVPMPLHPKRLRERGYNQSEYIARGIRDITRIPIDSAHVVRARNTPQQALKGGEERKDNVAKAFDVIHPEDLAGKHILVVDDLITTGETMKACIKEMHRIKGATFTVFALCKAQ